MTTIKKCGMKGFIQRYGIVNAVKRGAFMFIKLHLVKDYEVRKVLWQEQASSKIKPYLKYKRHRCSGLSFPQNDVENPIWILLEQKVLNRHRSLFRSAMNLYVNIRIKNHFAEWSKHLQITFDARLHWKEKDTGQIPMAGYADLMRFTLLEHYGGTWIDPTVYLTEPIPDMILNSDFLQYRIHCCW